MNMLSTLTYLGGGVEAPHPTKFSKVHRKGKNEERKEKKFGKTQKKYQILIVFNVKFLKFS